MCFEFEDHKLIFIFWARDFKCSRKYGSGLSCCWALLRLELSDSNCVWFSTELSSKNRINILFGGFSWKELVHFGLLWEQDSTLSLISRDSICRQSWFEDWVLKSGLRNYGSSLSFYIAGSADLWIDLIPRFCYILLG